MSKLYLVFGQENSKRFNFITDSIDKANLVAALFIEYSTLPLIHPTAFSTPHVNKSMENIYFWNRVVAVLSELNVRKYSGPDGWFRSG